MIGADAADLNHKEPAGRWHEQLLLDRVTSLRFSRLLLAPMLLFAAVPALAQSLSQPMKSAGDVKGRIIQLAQSYAGQGDPDFARQRSLDVLVNQLVALSPQPPLKDRLSLLYGAWKQIWGPYDYRNNKRGIDPELNVDEIYQVVFQDGFYYNVAPNFKKGNKERERIVLLRGEFKLDPQSPELLRVRFTNLFGLQGRPTAQTLWQLPALAESHRLPNLNTVLPGLFVRLFFGGGALREVYVDGDLRILYGSNGKDSAKESIYVMTRMDTAQ